jgi:hypothetical protein
MSRLYQDLAALVIPVSAGAGASNAVVVPADAEWLTIFTPGSLAAVTFQVQVSPYLTGVAAADFFGLQRVAPTILSVADSNAAVLFEVTGFKRVRIANGGVTIAVHTFQLRARCG